MHGGCVGYAAAQFLRRYWSNGNLPAKVIPIRGLRSSHDHITNNVWTAIDDSYAAIVKPGLFVKIGCQNHIPKGERTPESVRPFAGHINLDSDIPEHCLSQLIVFRARRIWTGPVRTRPFLRTASTTGSQKNILV